MRRRWLVVLGVVAVLVMAAIPIGLFLVLGSDSGDEADVSSAARASNEPVAAGSPPPGANAPGVALVEEGAVVLSGISAARPGADSVVVSFQADRGSVVAVQVRDNAGAEVGESSARQQPGQSVIVVPLTRSVPGTLRLVVAAAPTGGGAATVASVAVGPRESLLRVISPAPGSRIAGDQVLVQLRTRNYAVSDQGQTPAPNQGHFHVALDDRTYVVVYGKRFTLRDVPPGPHRLVVTANENDHSAHGTVEEVVVRFETTA